MYIEKVKDNFLLAFWTLLRLYSIQNTHKTRVSDSWDTIVSMILPHLTIHFVVNFFIVIFFSDKNYYSIIVELKKIFNFHIINFFCKKIYHKIIHYKVDWR
jgi:hypothetical protein